jgi:formylglycine-generating enzyme required for sulfatase activity
VEAIAWYSGNSSGTSHPVGQKAPNGLGIYDMSGNVCEWCWDWIGDYSAGTKTDPKGPSSGSSRIYRGGGWPHKDIYMRITDRHGMFPSWRTGYIGFRLARSQS